MADTTQPSGQEPQAPGQDPINGGQEPTTTPTDQASQGNEDWKEQELKRARDEAARYRTKLREIEEAQQKAAREEAERRGEYERLYKETDSKLAQVQSELDSLRTFKAEIEEREEADRKVLLAKLPDDMKDTFATASKQQLQTILERLAATGASPAPNRVPPKPNQGDGSAPPPAPRPGEPGWLEHALQRQGV